MVLPFYGIAPAAAPISPGVKSRAVWRFFNSAARASSVHVLGSQPEGGAFANSATV